MTRSTKRTRLIRRNADAPQRTHFFLFTDVPWPVSQWLRSSPYPTRTSAATPAFGRIYRGLHPKNGTLNLQPVPCFPRSLQRKGAWVCCHIGAVETGIVLN